jgi:hypothetical protein
MNNNMGNGQAPIYTERQITNNNEVPSYQSNSQGRISYPSYPSQQSYASYGINNNGSAQAVGNHPVSAKEIVSQYANWQGNQVLSSIREMGSTVEQAK